MNVLTKMGLIHHIVRWRLTWDKRDTKRAFTVPGNPKFMGPRDAAKLIRDSDVVCTSGMAGHQRLAIMYWAIRELFDETGHPRNLTMMCTGGQGSRGKVPGSMEELGVEGLCVRMVTAHHETLKAQLKLAAKGKLELQCLPQGILTFLLDAQGRGEDSLLSETGLGTFLDPRVGTGSAIFDKTAEQLITVEDGKLRFRAPKVNVAMFSAPAADREGNIYLKNASIVAETFEIIRAAHANGGRVIANVGLIVDKGYDKVAVPASDLDAIVHDPNCEQAVSIKHRKPWRMFTTDSDLPIEKAIERARFINEVLRITPKRSKVDDAVARLAAATFAEHGAGCNYLNIGVGLPEEVCRMLFEAGLLDRLKVFTETGVIGGLPTPGVFFGGAACPEKMVPSAEIFHLVYNELDCTILGAVEADSEGNVNVSKRGEGPLNYVGPGGFIDITTGAKMIIFVAAWMPRAKVTIDDGKIHFTERDKPKFVDHVSEITFCGRKALDTGKKVFYVTTVGLFQLTAKGMELIRVMPGVDIRKDILEPCTMKVVLPESGKVPEVDRSIVTGQGFRLAFDVKTK